MNRLLLTLIITCMTVHSIGAGNVLLDEAFTLDVNGISLGYKSIYEITENQTILFDADLDDSLTEEVTNEINSNLVDVKLAKEVSDVDYGSSNELGGFGSPQNMYAPNRIFVHLGSGFGNSFFATLRVYEDGDTSCFIHLRKSSWIEASYLTQKNILLHEIYHCLNWGHQTTKNIYVEGFDFSAQDANEVLYRLYDESNTLGMVSVTFSNSEGKAIGFIAPHRVSKKPARRARTTYTNGEFVKLMPGKYKIQVGGSYVRKITKSGKVKYTSKLKKAKKFNLNDTTVGHDLNVIDD